VTETPDKTTRRGCLRFLGSAAVSAALLSAAPGAALTRPAAREGQPDPSADDYDVIIARLKFNYSLGPRAANWNVYPGADRYLLEELTKVVRCKVKLPPGCGGQAPGEGNDGQFNAVVTFDDADGMRRQPLLFLTGEGILKLTAAQQANVKRAVTEGGFLLIDDCVLAPSGDLLFQSAYKEMEAAFGKGSVVKIPKTHEIFHNVYDLGAIGLPYCQGKNHGAHAVFVGDRIAVFLSPTDIHCGWADRNHEWFPNPALGVHGYKEAIQMGINILMYVMSH